MLLHVPEVLSTDEIEDAYGTHAIRLAAGDTMRHPAATLRRPEPVMRGKRLTALLSIQSLLRAWSAT
jgi:PKHD-type hydroxylase